MDRFGRIFLTGMPGSGKTVVGRFLAKIMQLSFIDLDLVIAEKAGMDINRIFAELGEEQFRQMEAEWLREAGNPELEFVLATGGGAPCFHENMQYMNAIGVTVFLDVPLDELCWRLIGRGTSKRPLLRDLSDEEVRVELHQKYEQRQVFYRQAQIHVIHSGDVSPLQRARDIEQALGQLKEISKT